MTPLLITTEILVQRPPPGSVAFLSPCCSIAAFGEARIVWQRDRKAPLYPLPTESAE